MIQASPEVFQVTVSAIVAQTDDISSFELVDPKGNELPNFAAGSHIHVHITDETSRQYSLCNDPSDTHRYLIAVLNEPEGRGGSRAMHEQVREGQEIMISGPDNHFELAGREARFHLLLAGGIGVTPMLAMIEQLEQAGKSYLLHYCTKSPQNTAFADRLKPFIAAGKVILHHDGGDPKNGLDIQELLIDYKIGTHLYACGPPGFMVAVNAAVGAWPPHAVHQEYFAARALTEEEKAWDDQAFTVRLSSTNAVVDVPGGQSIVDALRAHGMQIRTDCEDGYCGTCITRFIEGEPVHRDSVLDEGDRQSYVMICCARAKSQELLLDL